MCHERERRAHLGVGFANSVRQGFPLHPLEALPPDLRPRRREARGAVLAGCALCPAPCRTGRANFKKQLRNVLAVYREAKMDVRQDVLMLLPSPPHILPNAS